MEIEEGLLKIITNETKDKICNMEVVTPEVFISLFSKHALEHNIELDNESVDKYFDDKIVFYTSLQDKTSENADRLSMSTSKAINAIKDKDETKLNAVLKETNDLRNEIEKLKISLYKDELTAVYNRRWLGANYLQEQEDKFDKDGLLALIDLNYFKQVNDTFGHIVGDKVLVFIANQLKKTSGKVVRYGGDEFIVLFDKDTSSELAKKQLHSLRESILKKHLTTKKDTSFRVSFSYGVCVYKKNDELSVIIENSDKNMYLDKIKIKKRVTGIEV